MSRYSFQTLARYSTVVTAAFSMGTAACDSDSSTSTPAEDTSTGTDTVAESDTTGGTDTASGDTSGTDTTPANPCEPNPCTNPAAATCDGNSVVAQAGPGACTVVDGAASCAYESTTTACAEGEVCSAGACAAAGNACEYNFDARVSYVTEIKLSKPPSATPPKEGEDDCCFDFTGDGVNDNALGKLLGLITGIAPDFDVNATIAEQISSGSLALLLETRGVTALTNATGISLNGFYGVDGDADLTNNAAGTSTFKANLNSFQPGTAIPWIAFSGVSIDASGVLSAGPAPFNLSVPILGATLDLRVDGTRLSSPVAAGPNGPDGGLSMGGDEGGRLGGFVAIETVAMAFSQYLEGACSCIPKVDPTKPYIGTKIASGKVQLDVNLGSAAACTDDICKQIGQYVPIAKSFITPDVDGDEDGILDSMSVGVRIKATSATMSGVMCEEVMQ